MTSLTVQLIFFAAVIAALFLAIRGAERVNDRHENPDAV